MRVSKLVVAGVLCALAVSACGVQSKPLAGSRAARLNRGPGVRARLDDPRAVHYQCLRAHHLNVSEPSATEIQVGRPGVGPLIKFLPTPGAAQEAQISGQVESAEVIGSALLYPNKAPGKLLTVVENCTAIGVKG